MAQNAAPKVHRAAVPGDSVSRLSVHLDAAVNADPRLKASVGSLYRDAASRGIAEDIIGWFWDSPLPAIYRSATAHEPVLLIDFTTIRRHTPGRSDTRVSWHADANFVGLSGTMRVAWVPVDAVGVDAPGLEFAFPAAPVRRQTIEDYILKAQEHPGNTLDDTQVSAMFGGNYRSWRPALGPGDVLTFDQWGVHRTDPSLDGKARTAIEFRMISLQDPPRRAKTESWIKGSVMLHDGRWVVGSATDLIAGRREPPGE